MATVVYVKQWARHNHNTGSITELSSPAVFTELEEAQDSTPAVPLTDWSVALDPADQRVWTADDKADYLHKVTITETILIGARRGG
jgi:hypothetical protein